MGNTMTEAHRDGDWVPPDCGSYSGCARGCAGCPGASAQPAREADKNHPENILREAAQTVAQRGTDRDSEEGERSMVTCVDAFNALTGHNLSETEGWKFMVILKLARARHEKYNRDDYLDGAAYMALAGESHAAGGA